MQLIFATGNKEKFQIAAAVSNTHDITLVQKQLDIEEIQGEDSESIIRHKAAAAFSILGQPLIVSDDTWNIPGLNGFPGPYMKSIEHWFNPQNFLDLTRNLTDRRIILTQSLMYQDKDQQKLFVTRHIGELLKEARGAYGYSLHKVIAMPGDNGLSVAEAYDQGTIHSEREVSIGWRTLLRWLKKET